MDERHDKRISYNTFELAEKQINLLPCDKRSLPNISLCYEEIDSPKNLNAAFDLLFTEVLKNNL